jgi:hypothetical protein
VLRLAAGIGRTPVVGSTCGSPGSNGDAVAIAPDDANTTVNVLVCESNTVAAADAPKHRAEFDVRLVVVDEGDRRRRAPVRRCLVCRSARVPVARRGSRDVDPGDAEFGRLPVQRERIANLSGVNVKPATPGVERQSYLDAARTACRRLFTSPVT